METITFNAKKVLASEPYQPRSSFEFVGRLQQLKMVVAAWMGSARHPPLSPLLVGDPGVGKNRLVYELARRANLDLYIFQGHEDVTAEDMACMVRFSDEAGKSMDYVLSPLVTAMQRGGICFIDEIGKIRPRALALLASVLDERRYIDSTLLGERIHAHPRFRFIAATNTGETSSLPEFVRSRLRPVIEMGHPPKEELEAIIAGHSANGPEIEKLLETFWDLFGESKRTPSPRDAVHLFALAGSLRQVEANGNHREGFSICFEGGAPAFAQGNQLTVTPAHVTEAFQQLFARASA
jgi:MoxR-like ATPase